MFRTMLVLDNPLSRKTLKAILQSQFPLMDIIEAEDGVEALQTIDSLRPGLVFMDIGLPGENGLELTKKIKSNYPTIIVAFVTIYDLSEYQDTAIQSSADYFFSKNSIASPGVLECVEAILVKKGFNVNALMGNID